MKKVLAFMMVVAVLCAATACSKKDEQKPDTTVTDAIAACDESAKAILDDPTPQALVAGADALVGAVDLLKVMDVTNESYNSLMQAAVRVFSAMDPNLNDGPAVEVKDKIYDRLSKFQGDGPAIKVMNKIQAEAKRIDSPVGEMPR